MKDHQGTGKPGRFVTDRPEEGMVPDGNAQRLDAIRSSNLAWTRKRQRSSAWTRQNFKLPRHEARLAARAFLERYPKAAYGSEIESWRVLPDDIIEFTMRRYPTAD